MKTAAVRCPSCGAKIGAHRQRCPRCRAVLAPVDPAVAAARSRLLARVTAGIVVAFLLLLAVLWMLRPRSLAPPGTATSAPVAARPVPPQPAAAPGSAPAERAFLDPAGAATIAYAAGDMPGALAHFQQAVERNPRDAESLSNLGQVLVRLNRAQEAIPYFQRALALNPDRWAYQFNLARALGQTGRWDDSVAAYRRAQRLFPDDYVTAFNLALALRKKGDDEGAAAEFQRAIALEPNDASFRIALGMTYERLQRQADAAAAYEEALRLAPKAPDAEVVRRRIAALRGTPAPASSGASAEAATAASSAAGPAPAGGPGR